MKEAYVTFKTAKLLKEKGFDWECHHEYHLAAAYPWFHRKKKNFNGKEYSGLINEWYSAPTQQMASRWLREEHKIHITTEPLEMFKKERVVHEPIIYILNDFDDFALEYKTVHLKECDTHEDAVEAALEYCLTNLI